MRDESKPQARLVPFLIPGVAILAAALVGTYSLLLGIVVLFLVPALLVPLGHNYGRFGARRREVNDRFMLEACDSGMMGRFRSIYRHLPANPRCRICLVPFGGFGRMLRISPSRKNPNFCTSCLDGSPEGVHEMEVGVLFADIRGFTSWSASQPASLAAKRLTEFYDIAGRVLMQDDALVEFVGDQVMALYLPGFPSLRGRTPDVMLAAARRLLHEVRKDANADALEIGIGINFGVASIGNVRKGAEKDFTAVGDVINTGARLQSAAHVGEIVVAEEAVFDRLTAPPEAADHRLLEIKGKSEALRVRVLRPE